MPFLNPLFLVALAAAALPIALHLLNRRNPKPVPFSTLRFIEIAVAKTRKSRHLTQVMILLLRVLIIALLALAFARPRLRSAGWLPEGPRTVLLVLDGTASMRAQQQDRANFDRARDWARSVLGRLRDRDKVAVVVAGVPAGRVVFPAISNHGLAERALRESACGYGTVDLVTMLRQTVNDLLVADPAAALEVHVFTDAQAANWHREQAAELGKLLKDEGVRLFVNRLDVPVAGNASLAGVEILPEALLGGGEILVRGKVRADAAAAGANVVRVLIEGQEKAQAGLTVPPNGAAPFALSVPIQTGKAFLQGTIQIQDDPLAADNTMAFALAQQDHVRVLLVNGSQASVDFQEDTYYVARALNPQRLAKPLIQTETLSWQEFLGRELDLWQTVVIANPPIFDATLAVKLEQYVGSGGTVVFYPGTSAGLENSYQALAAFKPLTLESERFTTTQTFGFLPTDRPAAVERSTRHVLRGLPEIDGQARLLIRLPGDPAAMPAETRPFFQYATETPVALRIPFGSGVFWLVSLSANRTWSEWPLAPSYVIFHQLLVRQSFERTSKTARVEVDGFAELGWTGTETTLKADVTAPDGQRTTRLLQRKHADQPFLVGDFEVPGIYRLDLQTTPPAQRLVAVKAPADESDLQPIGEQELATSLQGADVLQSSDPVQHQELVAGLTTGQPLWPWLLLLAFLLGIAEVLFANVRSWRQSVPEAMQTLLRGRA